MGLNKGMEQAGKNMLHPKSRKKGAPKSDAWRGIGSGKGRAVRGTGRRRRGRR